MKTNNTSARSRIRSFGVLASLALPLGGLLAMSIPAFGQTITWDSGCGYARVNLNLILRKAFL